MLKKILILTFFLLAKLAIAEEVLDLYKVPPSQISHFQFLKQPQKKLDILSAQNFENTLEKIQQTHEKNQIISRYQQFYKGIPVAGAQAIVVQSKALSSHSSFVNGHLIEGIQLDIMPAITEKEALTLAKTAYAKTATTKDESTQLQIRKEGNNPLQLVYRVSFKTESEWPFFLIDANNGKILTQWNNIQNYDESGPGGNIKTQEYWYGKDNLPMLDFLQKGSSCSMENSKVRVVHLHFIDDKHDFKLTPYQYPCGNNPEEFVNGAYSTLNDAFYFGNAIYDLYQEWYGLPVLQNKTGEIIPVIMRVHYGKNYENAFWNGRTMSFGDGANNFHPLVSLDVAAHEITHGFTAFHSNLEYHDESGALNESLSDMAGFAARAYLLETAPEIYNKAHLTPNKITWGIGETLVKPAFHREALRFIDRPSKDGNSADCYQASLANKTGESCQIDYKSLVVFANNNFPNENYRQGFIVHSGSGIYNKAFYLLANQIGIKKAYHVMVLANTNYLTPTSNFTSAACDILHAAKDLQVDIKMTRHIFDQVGISTEDCKAL